MTGSGTKTFFPALGEARTKDVRMERILVMGNRKGFAPIANPVWTEAITREVEMFKFLAYYYGILFFLKAFGIGEKEDRE